MPKRKRPTADAAAEADAELPRAKRARRDYLPEAAIRPTVNTGASCYWNASLQSICGMRGTMAELCRDWDECVVGDRVTLTDDAR